MPETELLKPCPHRKARGGYLVCTITDTEIGSGKTTDLTTVEVCGECLVPDILQQVNCKNLNLGKQHQAIKQLSCDGASINFAVELGWWANCKVVGFDERLDYQIKCSANCPVYQPIHKDLAGEEIIQVGNFDAVEARDREIRQAVLVILYKYHDRHPERYGCFDVTPEFIAKSLKISVRDVVGVVSPMEEEREVATFRYESDLYFRYTAITSKGIKMIDENPLFDRLDTAQVRVMGDQINNQIDHSQIGVIAGRQSQVEVSQEFNFAASTDEIRVIIEELRKSIEVFPAQKQHEASEYVSDIEAEVISNKPKQYRLKSYFSSLFKLAEGTNAVIELLHKLAQALIISKILPPGLH